MSALPPKANIPGAERNVRFVPMADIAAPDPQGFSWSTCKYSGTTNADFCRVPMMRCRLDVT